MALEDRKRIIGDLPQTAGSVILILYLLGFVTGNAHLAKWGVYSFELLNAHYLAAGLITAMVFAIFAFVVGRRLFHIEDDFKNFAQLGQNYRWPRVWSIFCLIYVLVELIFGGIVAMFWTSTLLFKHPEGLLELTIVLTVAFVLDYYLLSRRGLYKKNHMWLCPYRLLSLWQ